MRGGAAPHPQIFEENVWACLGIVFRINRTSHYEKALKPQLGQKTNKENESRCSATIFQELGIATTYFSRARGL